MGLIEKTNTINRSTYFRQYNKIQQNKGRVIEILNVILTILGRDKLNLYDFKGPGKPLSPQIVDAILKEYLVDLLFDEWASFQTSRELISSYLNSISDKDELNNAAGQALIRRLKESLYQVDENTLNREQMQIYNVFSNWITNNAVDENAEDNFKKLVQQLDASFNLSNEQLDLVDKILSHMNYQRKEKPKRREGAALPVEIKEVGVGLGGQVALEKRIGKEFQEERERIEKEANEEFKKEIKRVEEIEMKSIESREQLIRAKDNFENENKRFVEEKKEEYKGKKSKFGSNAWIFNKLFSRDDSTLDEQSKSYFNFKKVRTVGDRKETDAEKKLRSTSAKEINKLIVEINKIINREFNFKTIDDFDLSQVF